MHAIAAMRRTVTGRIGAPWKRSATAGLRQRRDDAACESEPALLRTLESEPGGLSSTEAALRLSGIGPNELSTQESLGTARLALRQFESPLVLILLFGVVIALLLREWTDAGIILAIVLGSSLLGFVQEHGASLALAALRRRLALTVQARRDGVLKTVPARDIVPGDVIELSAGNLIPADGRVLAARDFLVSESSLTGESFPVEKRPGIVPRDAPPASRTNCVFLGTSVRSGTGQVLVTHTGQSTAYGAIAARIAARAPETSFARGVRDFGYLLLRVMAATVLFVLVVNQLLGRPIVDSLLFAVALAVGLSPELLPAIVSVTLSRGARDMARRGVLVRRLEAIENFGSLDILCTDKTGTLTEGEVKLESALDARGEASAEVLRLAFLNAAFETGIENPLDAALVAAGTQVGLTTGGYRKLDEIPYDFIRKRLTVVVEGQDDGRRLLISKGAFDQVLAVCGLEEPLREELGERYRTYGQRGLRVLALALKHVEQREAYGHEDESDMAFAGFLLFFDPPKANAAQTLRELAGLGIRVKVVSGDNRYVAAHLTEAVGLDTGAMLTGAPIAALKDESLWHLAERTVLFVEVDPQQKERIVRALQRTGHVVGYLGDGINDAPALHAADVGISVDQAVDVARESADVVLLGPDLEVLKRGVEDGRRTFANPLKYICITTSANFGNMVSMALATPLLPFLPLLAKQILLNNFLSDLPSIAISGDNVDPDRLARAQRWDMAEVRRFMLVFGLLSTVFDLLTFLLLLQVFAAGEQAFQSAWFVVSLLTELAVLLVLRTRGPFWRSRPSAPLLWTTVLVGLIAVGLPYAGSFAGLFGFAPLSWHLLVAMLGVTLAYVAATESAKRFFYRDSPGAGLR